jgi:hypothetical protein
MGDTGNMKGIFGEALNPVNAFMGEGFVYSFVARFLNSLENQKGIVKTLNGLG